MLCFFTRKDVTGADMARLIYRVQWKLFRRRGRERELHMEVNELKSCVEKLNALKKDTQASQKKGLPFILTSVVLWSLILVIRLIIQDLQTANLLTFFCACLLVPVAYLFSRLFKADSFKTKGNPVSVLGLAATMNQFLYLLIVMWAFSCKPDAMLMIFAIVFGAHLLPFSWVYDSKAYLVLSITEAVGALVIGSLWGSIPVAAFIVCAEIVLSILLYRECREL